MKQVLIGLFSVFVFVSCQKEDFVLTRSSTSSVIQYRSLDHDIVTFRGYLYDLFDLICNATKEISLTHTESVVENYESYIELIKEKVDVEAMDSIIECSLVASQNLLGGLDSTAVFSIIRSAYSDWLDVNDPLPSVNTTNLPCFEAYLEEYIAAFDEYETSLYASWLTFDVVGVAQAVHTLWIKIHKARSRFFDCVD